MIVLKTAMENVAVRLQEAGRTLSARWVGNHAQEILRIEAGIPRYGVDFSEDNLLLETGLDHAVSFNKGCYLGQEVIERIRSRGHVNRKLSGLVIDDHAPASRGDTITANGKSVGSITSSIISPRLEQPIALGYVSKEFWSPGTRVTIRSGSAESSATVAALPFVQFA